MSKNTVSPKFVDNQRQLLKAAYVEQARLNNHLSAVSSTIIALESSLAAYAQEPLLLTGKVHGQNHSLPMVIRNIFLQENNAMSLHAIVQEVQKVIPGTSLKTVAGALSRYTNGRGTRSQLFIRIASGVYRLRDSESDTIKPPAQRTYTSSRTKKIQPAKFGLYDGSVKPVVKRGSKNQNQNKN